MFEQGKNSRTLGKRIRSFERHHRSCQACGSVDGLEIRSHHKKNDIILCQVCGSSYLVECVQPLRLNYQAFKFEQDYWFMEG